MLPSLLGAFWDFLIKYAPRTPTKNSLWLIGGCFAMAAPVSLCSLQFPVVKDIWTSSFVLVAGGYSAILLGAMHQAIDVWGWKVWASIFVWIGTNAILIYFINGITGFVPFALRFVGGDVKAWFDQIVIPGMGVFVAHLLGLVLAIALAGYLYRNKVFLRV